MAVVYVVADILRMHTHQRSHNHTQKHQGKTNNPGKSDSLWCVTVCVWIVSRYSGSVAVGGAKSSCHLSQGTE